MRDGALGLIKFATNHIYSKQAAWMCFADYRILGDLLNMQYPDKLEEGE